MEAELCNTSMLQQWDNVHKQQNGSPRDVYVKFLNMKSTMINNHCLFLTMKILGTKERKLRFFRTKSKEDTLNALLLNHFSHTV